jgi:hypothetical protein
MSGVIVKGEGDELESTDKWAIPREIAGEMTPPPPVAPSKRAGDRHLTRTVASPIPAMLAETMGLAEERDAPARPPGTGSTRR